MNKSFLNKLILANILLALAAPAALQAQTTASAAAKPTTPPKEADAILGDWLTENGKGRVRIFKTKQGSYVGKIIWLREPNNEEGKPKVDRNNPDESQRTRPIMGLFVLRDFVHDAKNVWHNGKIYDPESGNDYSCTMTLVEPNKLEVRGYIGVSLFGRTSVWTR
jgi:uncharacterized protein (DUF2147 family)